MFSFNKKINKYFTKCLKYFDVKLDFPAYFSINKLSDEV